MDEKRVRIEEEPRVLEDPDRVPALMQAMSRSQPLALRQLSNAIYTVGREVLANPAAILPPQGDYRYGQDKLIEYLNRNQDIPEEELLNVAFRFNSIRNNKNLADLNFAGLRYCAARGYLRCVERIIYYLFREK